MESASVFQQRRSGVLLHITSLPSGTLGHDAFRFIEFLHHAKVSIWQMLPINPTHSDGSPYQCLSAHAINPSLLSLEKLQQEDWFDSERLNRLKNEIIIEDAFQQFSDKADDALKQRYAEFTDQHAYWLDDYVLFCELRQLNNNKGWFDWDEPIRNRDSKVLAEVKYSVRIELELRRFEQFLLFSQWQKIKTYASEMNVLLFGDMPIFVAYDSAEVWAAPDMFKLDEQGQPTVVAGVPPDYFSETGQRWGNPLYDWRRHENQGFLWWQQRLQTQLELFDLIRIDHFRGFDACWEIPVECETAIEGNWVTAPGDELFSALVKRFGELPLVAEDLGIITEQVTALREKYAMPGMKILHFAFGGDAENPYLPHQHTHDTVIYTGTHDNDTSIGWYVSSEQHVKQHFHDYIGNADTTDIAWTLIQTALSSVANTAIVPFQDVLALNGEHRMNVPGTVEGNWIWQFDWAMVPPDAVDRLRKLNELYGRS